MTQTVILLTMALLLTPLSAWGFSTAASSIKRQDQAPAQTAPWSDDEYRQFYEASAAQDLAKKHEFIAKYPESPLTALMRRSLILSYIQNKNLNKAFEVADPYFASNPQHYTDAFKFAYGSLFEKAGATLPAKPTEDFEILINLIVMANGAMRAKNTSFDKQTKKYINYTSALIEAGGIPPTLPPERWRGHENAYESTIQQTLGLINFNNQSYQEAADNLRRAGELGPSDPVTFYLLGDALRLGKYADASKAVQDTQKQYNEITDQLKQIEEQVNQINAELAKLSKGRETAQTKARIEELTQQGEELNQRGKELSEQLEGLTAQNDQQVDQVNQIVDEMIRVYAKTVALSEGIPQLQKTAREHLERYYKYRHQNSLDGLPELVQKMKTELP